MVNWKKVLIATGVVVTGVYVYRNLTYQCPDSEKGGGSFEEVYAQLLASRGMTEIPTLNLSSNDNRKIRQPTAESKPILILYGTEYGASREIAYKLEKQILDSKTTKWNPRVVDMEDFSVLELEKEQLILAICSTNGDGVPPTSARAFFDAQLGGIEDETTVNSKPAMNNVKYTVLALGDKTYPHYCRAGKVVDKKFAEYGAQRIIPRADVDQEDWVVINKWLADVIQTLESEEFANQLVVKEEDYLYDKQEQGLFGDDSKKGPSRKTPYLARVVDKRLLTTVLPNEVDPKETLHVEIELEEGCGIEYVSGDALAILPTNDAKEVQALLNAWFGKDANNKAKHIIATPPWNYKPRNATEEPKKNLTLREALDKLYDLKNVKPELLTLLKRNTTSAEESKKLDQLLANGGTSKSNVELHEKYLKGREVVDIFEDFPVAVKETSIDSILSEVRQLLPRYYSISSSYRVNPKRVTITAAIVRYQTHGKDRQGVTTCYLADRVSIGDRLPIFVSTNPDFRLPADPVKPIIMVGPGTGIAPFRAFLQERELLMKTQGGSATSVGANVLFFGCRFKERDYLYRKELENYEAEGKLVLSTAFSRDTDKKVYVQHRIKENSSFLWKLLEEQGAHLYICGDAQYMAPDVHKALKEIIITEGNRTEAEAEEYLSGLEKNRRYQRDVWF
eukprot:TRINITY_DN942_c0_g1_i1.p1 TRINITY_DN942_c0_g1~~TRINITY_DN942_c0_g1_i1.p1  ORF type:complete len:678 (-),score=214.25 TRINITY_DN942_c0_g1_i1:157-2190(-)